ncbi:MAG: hypothetical protein JXJ19_03625 [Elusimicrobia bacterium]|nr:hypothetical protein [Elusimicrobiota bacterium]
MIYIYQLFLFTASVIALPFAVGWIYFKKGAMTDLAERFTIYGREIRERLKGGNYRLWVHAASVGEIKLLQKLPGFTGAGTMITCTTSSGKKVAGQLFPEAAALIMPLDFVFLIKRLKRLCGPERVIILETELWPGLIHTLKDRKIFLLNARLSPGKFAVYRMMKPLLCGIFASVEKIYARTAGDKAMFEKLGVPKGRLRILGDMKYNFARPGIDTRDRRFSRPGFPVIVCGSTHAGEEDILMDIFEELKDRYRELSMVISPRHVERAGDIASRAGKRALKYSMWTDMAGAIEKNELIIVDVIGELARIYSLAQIVFIGGTLVPAGGHNVIEAAVWGVPVVIGPYFDNILDTVEEFRTSGGLRVAGDGKELGRIIFGLLGDPGRMRKMGQNNIDLAFRKKQGLLDSIGDIKSII